MKQGNINNATSIISINWDCPGKQTSLWSPNEASAYQNLSLFKRPDPKEISMANTEIKCPRLPTGISRSWSFMNVGKGFFLLSLFFLLFNNLSSYFNCRILSQVLSTHPCHHLSPYILDPESSYRNLENYTTYLLNSVSGHWAEYIKSHQERQ